ncbi:MAG: hypothetical protein ACK4SY_02535 [Pyrobaculum sp.]
MEFIVPLCSWRDFEEVTFIVREGSVIAVGRTAAGFDERVIDVGEIATILAPYMELYDTLAAGLAEVLTVEYRPESREVYSWLKHHVRFIDSASAKFGKLIDKVGPFTVRKFLQAVYMPYSGHALTLTYVAYPYRDAVVVAENRGRVMAIGSVLVEWGGVKVASAGIRTLAGALLLAQAAPELMPELREIRKKLEEFVKSAPIPPCR